MSQKDDELSQVKIRIEKIVIQTMFANLPIFSKQTLPPPSQQYPSSSQSLQPQSASRLKPVSLEQFFPYIAKSAKKNPLDDSLQEQIKQYHQQKIPIYRVCRLKQWMNLNRHNIHADGDQYQRFARGRIIGSNNVEAVFREEIDFIGNFQGTFQSGQPENEDQPYYFYFQGNISHFRLLRIAGKELTFQQKNDYSDLTKFKGYFKGNILQNLNSQRMFKQSINSLKNLTKNQIKQYQQKYIRSRRSLKTQYFVPTFTRFEIGKIRQICLQKSSATVWGTLFITIQMNEEIKILLQEQWQQNIKTKFHINFNRTVPYDLPFYDPRQFQATEDETEYEWDQIWDVVHWKLDWIEKHNRMQYSIQTPFTVQLDNSYGIFYAPFNLTILKLIITIHDIKINEHTLMHISVCDLHDFNEMEKGIRKQYHPFTPFEDLKLNKDEKNPQMRYQKQIDRLSKIQCPSGRDMGQYRIANNRMFLFPYHNQVLVNTNTKTSSIGWLLGITPRTDYFKRPQINSVSGGYQKALEAMEKGNQKGIDVFKMQRWMHIHIQIPIFKYPVIDMINIFVPLVILAAISMMMFGQQNGVNADGITVFWIRIASSSNILIAYVTLIPIIRSRLPPSPSLTLIEIVIYASTAPSFLAVLSVYLTGHIFVLKYYETFDPWTDWLFMISFLISSIFFVIMVILVSIYISKKYITDYTIRQYCPSGVRRMCAPFYLQYMDKVEEIRKEFSIQRQNIVYRDEDE